MEVMVDYETVIAAVTSSLGVSLGGAYWLARTLIENKLLTALEDRKAELSRQLETHKLGLSQTLEQTRSELQSALTRDQARIEGQVRQEVERHLGQEASQRQYEYDARRRLYLAIGPLRFQLLLACRDLAGRVESFGAYERFELSLDTYYGRSTLYRILRPLAIAEAIENQVALNDFSIDPGALVCLRFRRTLTRIWSGSEVIGQRSDADWSSQVQHVFADSLSICAQALICRGDSDGHRIYRFDEFNESLDREGPERVAPFDVLLTDFQPHSKPILWLRLVAHGHACNALVQRLGTEMGFEQKVFPTQLLLQQGGDPTTIADLQACLSRIGSVELVAI
jgi:hypothetical protein